MGLAVMFGALAGCGGSTEAIGLSTYPGPGAERASRGSGRPTLLVENASADDVAIRLNGFRIGTATRGRSCIRLPTTIGRVALELVPMGSGPRRAEPVFLELGAHWRVSIGPAGIDGLGEVPMWPSAGDCSARARNGS